MVKIDIRSGMELGGSCLGPKGKIGFGLVAFPRGAFNSTVLHSE